MRYIVIEAWSNVQPFYEKCTIRKANQDDTNWDGFNFISGSNRDGVSINIYNGLEKAIVRSGYNPQYIQFDLSISKAQISKILSKYTWDQKVGLIKKEK